MTETQDESAIRRLSLVGRGESDDFRGLFVTSYATVVRTVHYIVQDFALAEEITQDAFLELLTHWRKVSTYDRPDLWVRRVAIRRAQRDHRRELRRPRVERAGATRPPPGEPSWPDPELMKAIRGLSPRQRSVVVLFYYEDRPMDEIADMLGCSASTGWSHLHAARKRLASVLGEEVSDDIG
jgi:RNA polymerase sigma factor (sigma-70 family)